MAVNYLVHGRKRWILYPPSGGKLLYSLTRGDDPLGIIPSKRFFLEEYPKLRLLQPHEDEEPSLIECVQEAGDIIFVPTSFYHMTLSLGGSIAVAFHPQQAQGTQWGTSHDSL